LSLALLVSCIRTPAPPISKSSWTTTTQNAIAIDGDQAAHLFQGSPPRSTMLFPNLPLDKQAKGPKIDPDDLFTIIDIPQFPKLFEGEPDAPKMKTLLYRCRTLPAHQLGQVMLDFLSIEGKVNTTRDLNMIVITDLAERIPLLKKYIQAFDRQVPQILVSTKVLELTYDRDFAYEVSNTFTKKDIQGNDALGSFLLRNSSTTLTNPGGSVINEMDLLLRPYRWSRKGLIDQLETTLKFLVNKGKARILSAPNIIVSQGTTAIINTGERLPVPIVTTTNAGVQTSFEYIDVGITLEVTPLQIHRNVVELDIYPSVKSVPRTVISGGASAPVVADRSVRTILRVADGELISVGGLLKVEKIEEESKIPILGDIPLLGVLFKSIHQQDVRTQLVFFMQVKILEREKVKGVKVFVPKEDPKINAFMKDFEKDYKKQKDSTLEEMKNQ